ELNYDLFKDYELAQAYYDSTVAVLPQDEENFEEIMKRSEILTDFVQQLQIIQREDSLLVLSEMNKAELQQLLEEVIAEQELLEEQKKKDARKLARQTTSAGGDAMAGRGFANPFGIDEESPTEGDSWYFYNLSAASTGRSQFLSKWGNRPLEDNWRISQKQSATTFVQETEVIPQDTASIVDTKIQEMPEEAEDGTAVLMGTIPFSEEAKAESRKKIEDAYFKLGGIYNFQLEEEENAIQIYEKLLTRFPGSEHEPETLYLLYLIYKPSDEPTSASYKQKLTDMYPKSIYAKLAINPNYREESDETAQRLQRLYKIAYDYYLQEDYNQAKLLVSRGLQQYPDNEFSDQLRILGILADGKIEGQ
ncbi:MAG: hypothetical protein KAI29_19770, partial [Cyclobacteriaceae bacterium]|nr:hypothetical protein [Cyclobacteriaceae bacterium]